MEDPSLRCIATGMTARGDVDTDDAVNVGKIIMLKMVGKTSDMTFLKKDQVTTLGAKANTGKKTEQQNEINPDVLFQRMIAVARVDGVDLHTCFQYEMTAQPASLFEPSGLMRQANKATLGDAIWTPMKGVDMALPITEPTETVTHVIDGGSLLHRLPWPKGATFDSVCNSYVDLVKRSYSNPVVVFDGYDDIPTTKDEAHFRRSHGVVGVQVAFSPCMVVDMKKEEFLANKVNKQRFIIMLSDKLEASGCRTVHSKGDADTVIVQTALRGAASAHTVVVAEDTDLLVLLCYHVATCNPESIPWPVLLRSGKKHCNKTVRVWNIKQVVHTLTTSVCRLLPFAHALSGCDTTSRIYGIGKAVTFRKLKSNTRLQQSGAVFLRQCLPVSDIVQAGERALVALYGGCDDEGLDKLRFTKFCEKVAQSTSSVQPCSLPPTSAAAANHSLRVYLQVQQWTEFDTHLDPINWGWFIGDGRLQPCQTHLPAAPDHLLHVIRCCCKTDCDTMRCTCKRHGLGCSTACGVCHGTSCANPVPITLEDVLKD
jgi:hypothetical protein